MKNKRLVKKILNFLYENRSEQFIDIYTNFEKRGCSVEAIDKALIDLKPFVDFDKTKLEYIGSLNEQNKKVKINSKGIEFYLDNAIKLSNHRIRRIEIIIAIIGCALLLYQFLAPKIKPYIIHNTSGLSDFMISIENDLDSSVTISYRNSFKMLFPDPYGFCSNGIDGVFEINDVLANESIIIKPGEEKLISCRLINQGLFYEDYAAGDKSVQFIIRTDEGKLYFSGLFPFNKETFKEYKLPFYIKNN